MINFIKDKNIFKHNTSRLLCNKVYKKIQYSTSLKLKVNQSLYHVHYKKKILKIFNYCLNTKNNFYLIYSSLK